MVWFCWCEKLWSFSCLFAVDGCTKKMIWQSYGSLERVQGIGNATQAGVLIVNLFLNQYSSTIESSLSHHITTTCFCWMVESDPRSSNNSLKTRWDSVTFHNATPMGHRDSQHQGAIIRRAISWGSFMPLKSQKRRLGSCPAGDQEVSPLGWEVSLRDGKIHGTFFKCHGNCTPFALLLFKKGELFGNLRALKGFWNGCKTFASFWKASQENGCIGDFLTITMVINHISKSWDDLPK